MKESNEMNTP